MEIFTKGIFGNIYYNINEKQRFVYKMWRSRENISMRKVRNIFMKSTGVVRRVDDLGRIVIPRDIRRMMQIKESEPMEFFVDKDAIVIKKIETNSYTLRQTEDWVELLDEKGKVLVEGHSLRPEEILTALNIDFEVEEVEEM